MEAIKQQMVKVKKNERAIALKAERLKKNSHFSFY